MDRDLQMQMLLIGGMSGDLDGMATSLASMERSALNQDRNRLRIARNISKENRATMEFLGFIFPLAPGEKVPKGRLLADKFPQDFVDPLAEDTVLMTVDAPPGWKFKPYGDNGYGSKLVDPLGRERGVMFYKGVCYDRSASFYLTRRYRINQRYNDEGYKDWKNMKLPYVQYYVQDADSNSELWTGAWVTMAEADRLEKYTTDYSGYLYKEERAAAMGVTWLKETYPDCDSVTAYW